MDAFAHRHILIEKVVETDEELVKLLVAKGAPQVD
jgi:hypothetical protein